MRAPWPGPRAAVHATIAGVLLHGGYLGPVYWAVAHGMPAGVSALIIGLQPLITAALASFMVGERIGLRHWLGLAVGIAGVALVVWPKLDFAALGITPLTTAVNVMGAVSISLGTVYQKRFAAALHVASGGAWQYAGASALVLAAALMLEDFRFDGSPQAWFALAWSVIVLSLGAISLLMILIRAGEVSRVAGLIFLVPAVSAAMARSAARMSGRRRISAAPSPIDQRLGVVYVASAGNATRTTLSVLLWLYPHLDGEFADRFLGWLCCRRFTSSQRAISVCIDEPDLLFINPQW